MEANLDPGIGPFSARILAMSEEEYVRTGFRSALEQLREGAKDDRLSAITLGMQQVASAQAMYRTARSLVAERSPTYRDLLVQLTMTRWFLVGSETLEQPERPASGESGEGLDGTGVKLMVVPNAGHLMPLQNPAGFAEALARALIDER